MTFFFQQHWESEYFFRKKHNPPFKLNGRSLIKSLYDNIKLNESFFFLKQCKHYDGIHFILLERVVFNDDECRSIFVGTSKMNVSIKMQELVKCKFYHYLDYTS